MESYSTEHNDCTSFVITADDSISSVAAEISTALGAQYQVSEITKALYLGKILNPLNAD